MTVADIEEKISEIKLLADDYEVAHSKEDDLHVNVLRVISEGEADARNLARKALETLDIEFPRYCA